MSERAFGRAPTPEPPGRVPRSAGDIAAEEAAALWRRPPRHVLVAMADEPRRRTRRPPEDFRRCLQCLFDHLAPENAAQTIEHLARLPVSTQAELAHVALTLLQRAMAAADLVWSKMYVEVGGVSAMTNSVRGRPWGRSGAA